MATQTHTIDLAGYDTPGVLIDRLSGFPADASMTFNYGDYACEAVISFDPDMTAEEKAERAMLKMLKAKYESN